MESLGLQPDPWQLKVLEEPQPRLLLNCSRQAGKSTVVAALALAEAMLVNFTLVLLISRSYRQSRELFRTLVEFHRRIGAPLLYRRNAGELTLSNGSRVVCLPCKDETIRGFAGVAITIIDEAAQVPDDIYRTVRPMLAVSGGRLICLSTPYGKRGFFWDAWEHGGDDWARIEVPATQVPRIAAEFLAAERRGLGDHWYRQEYLCAFESVQGLVFPLFNQCVTAGPIPPAVRRVGGIDFGYRNPFAAVWGHLDANGVLWIDGEHYSRQKSLSHHADHLPRDVAWFCDPSGATERNELRLAGFNIRRGKNALHPGIAAVNARIESGRLFVRQDACPNLIAEAGLYRYSDVPAERNAEVPVDEHNHALSALRYLISMLDDHHLAGRPSQPPPDKGPPAPLEPGWRPIRDKWCNIWNEEIWTRIG
jgi:hypothetical protein